MSHVHRRGDLLLQAGRTRFVNAERFLIEIVASGGVSASAASHANVAKLAATALSLQVVDIAELIEYHRVLPDLSERLLSEISGQGRQISTGIDFALMRDETHRGSGEAALGHGVHVGRMRSRVSDCVSYSMWLQFDAG